MVHQASSLYSIIGVLFDPKLSLGNDVFVDLENNGKQQHNASHVEGKELVHYRLYLGVTLKVLPQELLHLCYLAIVKEYHCPSDHEVGSVPAEHVVVDVHIEYVGQDGKDHREDDVLAVKAVGELVEHYDLNGVAKAETSQEP